jgi:hypothetical protein
VDLPVVVTLLVVAVVLAVVAGAAAVALGVALSRTRRDQQALAEQLASGRAEQAALRARIDGLAVARPAGPVAGTSAHDATDFVITTLPGNPGGSGVPLAGVDERAWDRSFVTVAAGESLVRAATLVQGLRRALSAESRNRIRFEMAREVKRARKQRRRDLRDARRRPATSSVRPLEEDAA